MKTWIIAVLVAITAFTGWWWTHSASSAATAATQTTAAPSTGVTANSTPQAVTTINPVPRTLKETLELTGAVVPVQEVLATSDLNGVKVLALLAEEGDTVKEGQVLAQLDTESLRYQLQQVDALRQRSEEEFNRLDRIKQSGAVSTDQLSEKWLAFQSSQAQFNDLKLKLERAAILAPANGVIYERGIASGALLTGGEVLFRIAGKGISEVELQVPETRLAQLARGQRGEIVMADGTRLEGTVRRISPRIHSLQRTAAVRVSLPTDKFYPIGSFATVALTIGEHAGLTLPVTALQKDSTGDFVWIVNDGKAHASRITSPFRDEQQMLVEGVSADTLVVASAGAFLQEGDNVHPVEAATP